MSKHPFLLPVALLLLFATALSAQPDLQVAGKIAFWSYRTGLAGIHTINSDGTGVIGLTSSADYDPAWSPDGMKISFNFSFR